MKNFIYLFSLLGLITLGACENNVRSTDDNAMMDQRDTSAIKEGFNTRGVPAEGIPDNNALRGDTLELGDNTDNSEVMRGLPQAISDKIRQDETLRKKRLIDSRQYSEGGTTYYELTFDNGERTKETFDDKGNRSQKPQ